MPRYLTKPSSKDDRELMRVIEEEFRSHHPEYQEIVFWRFARQYPVPLKYAVKALKAGYSHPCQAAMDRVIPRRLVS